MNRNGQTEELVDRLTSSASTFSMFALGPTNDNRPEVGVSDVLTAMLHGRSEAYLADNVDNLYELFAPSVGDASLLHLTYEYYTI